MALFILAAAGLRFFRLEQQSLWNDEMFSLEVAALPLPAIQPELAAHFHHPPLYFYLLHFVLGWFGQNAWALRIISAAAGSLTAGLVYYYGRRLAGRWAGAFAALLCIVSPFHLAYSQEGRPYALAGLLALASCASFLMTIRERGRTQAIVYPAATVALLYTHHWGLFVIAAQGITFLLMRRTTPGAARRIVVAWIVIYLLYLPEVPALFGQSGISRLPQAPTLQQEWFWSRPPSVGELYAMAGAFSGSYFKMASAAFESPPAIRITASAALIVLAAAAVALVFKKGINSALRGTIACGGLALLLPFLASFIWPEVFLWYRYTVILFPLFCVAIGSAPSIPQREGKEAFLGGLNLWGLCAGAILLLASSAGSVRYYSWSKSNARDVALYADSLTRAGAGILIRPRSFAPLLNYYYRGAAKQLDETYLDKPLGDIVDTASSFVYCSLDVPNPIREYMEGHFVKKAERRFPGEAHMGMIVGCYAQPPDTSGD